MRIAENRVFIEGILAENDLKYGSYVKNGKTVETIGGTLKVLVEKSTDEIMEIPVSMFAQKYKNDGGLNPAFTGIETVMNDYKSIAAMGNKDLATRVRVSNGKITKNEYFNQQGQLVSFPRIQASFCNRITGDLHPKAEFTLEFVVESMKYAVDRDGVELDPKKMLISTIVPTYGDKIELIELVADKPNVINGIETYWEPGKTFKAIGNLNFTSKSEKIMEQVGFGEPREITRTKTISELVINGGSQEPLEGDFAFDIDEINKGIANHKVYLQQLKEKPAGNHGQKNTPAPAAIADINDLGF